MKRRHFVELLETNQWRANADNTGWLLASLVAVVVPHMGRMPMWVTAMFALLVIWRWLVIARGFARPGRWTLVVLALGAIIAIMAQFQGVLGRDSGVALLALLAGLKLLETRVVRDAYVTLFLTYFLIITNFLYSQGIFIGVYMSAVTVMSSAALIGMQHSAGEVPARQRVRIASRILAQALPLMMVGFLLFPRLPGPLWSLPKDAHAGVTGLSDSMSPGQVSSLSQSSAVAFRVKFEGDAPDPSAMYWRGPVLEITDGYKWQRSKRRVTMVGQSSLVAAGGRTVEYTVTLEPTYHRWLFALELNTDKPDGATLLDNGELVLGQPIRERRRYRVRSQLDYTLLARTTHELTAASILPPGMHPKTRQLAARWAAADSRPEALVARALTHFRNLPFVYTLEPPLMTGDSVDAFMFLNRRGFCEHYAAAFTILMRAAGVPARVVTGYQGGEFNEISDYWLVRQRDAHAWAEVWMGARGWVRVDPTAAVAPERVEVGVDEALPDSAADAVFGLARSDLLSSWWRRARLGWDTVNSSWNQWILGYGAARQRQFLLDLGLDVSSWRDIGTAFFLASGLALALAAALIWRRPSRRDPSADSYLAFCRKLKRHGLVRSPNEGPQDFCLRAQLALPQMHREIGDITSMYLAARYGLGGVQAAAQLAREVRRFTVAPVVI